MKKNQAKLIIVFITILLLYNTSLVLAQQNIIDSLENELNIAEEKNKAWILNQLAYKVLSSSNEKAIEYAERAVEIAKKTGETKQEANAYRLIGMTYYFKAQYDSTLLNWKLTKQKFEEIGDTVELARTLNELGVVYKAWGQLDSANSYYHQALKFQEKLGDKPGMAQTLSNIGTLYWQYDRFDKVLKYYNQTLLIYEELNKPNSIAKVLNNIGTVYTEIKNFDKALETFERAKKIYKKNGFKPGISNTLTNLAGVYNETQKYELALEASLEAYKINKEIGKEIELPANLKFMGETYIKLKKYSLALNNLNKAVQLYEKSNSTKEASDVYKLISNAKTELGRYKDALEAYKRYSVLKDSIFTEESHKQIEEMNTKYETEKKEGQIKLLNKENQLKDKENQQQRLIIYFFIGGLIIVLLFSVIIYKQFRDKKKANILLEHQNEEISRQRDQIMAQKQAITDSIQYASRIQSALLPPEKVLSNLLPDDHFIFFKPRDIVSGDFYWFAEADNKIIAAAADCTGHGVPGAFMSMLGVTFLTEIVNKIEDLKANEILNELRANVIKSLHQTGKENEAKDGMDIALSIIDLENMELQFAGAYNPLYLIRNGELIQTKANKMPIGIYFRGEKPFTNNTIKIKKGDILYMFSDGFVDQFGGEQGRKFMAKNFKNLLLSIHKNSMAEQKEILNKELIKWRGSIEQIDDIIVLGIKI